MCAFGPPTGTQEQKNPEKPQGGGGIHPPPPSKARGNIEIAFSINTTNDSEGVN